MMMVSRMKYIYWLVGFGSMLILLLFMQRNMQLNTKLPTKLMFIRNYTEKIQKCTEKRTVAFVKVHKAASTTITSILQRFGYTRNLTFALPKQDAYHIGLFETLNPANIMPIPNGSVYEIVCQHVVFNKDAFSRYLPPGISNIAAVREPTERFMSSFLGFPVYSYRVKQLSKSPKQDQISLMREYLTDPELYEPAEYKNGSLVFNRMSFDLGLPKEQYRNDSYITEYIHMLDDSMFFVLVADRFEESLVMLKRKMCWSTKDIVYWSQHRKLYEKPELPPDITETLRKQSPSDFKIYEYFNHKLSYMSSAEVRLHEEVTEFQMILRKVSSFCDPSKKQTAVFHSSATAVSDGFTFVQQDCQLLTMIESDFVKKLVRIQVPKEKQNEFKGWNDH